jgi:hypothetical protein
MNAEQENDSLEQKLRDLEDRISKSIGEAERVAIRNQISATQSLLAELYKIYHEASIEW